MSTAPEAEPRDVRVCVFGDSLVAGLGDPKALGWVGRVAARTPVSTGVRLTAYNLGVLGEGAEEVAVRIPMESAPRFARGSQHRVVVSVGVADAQRAVQPELSAAALDFGLGSVSVPALVVGPPPVGDADLQARITDLDAAYADVCKRRDVPYIATAAPLARKAAWQRARSDDGVHPNQAGYGMLAYVVLAGGWYPWLGVETPREPVKHRRQ
ncbi:GDSL-type esterase/lipase family protein [Haloactinopolyspora sp.]|uniref:GDSL-type esterase/lipase family protein n=1 Tax=Haloactinopolyspora sp. TaxID=1966353 RepID=UPI0026349539|nr:GDSL-type esterase/lipase family protein [Haloactinopolyspora sp.]